ncbi:PilN domain-containing protein [Ulvibacterium sp.]|uniref:PilN domain-containing protein n=1 Tax=Ulvibacterium sp. TaxID=2665914 RepID=UPI00263291D6|nr:PilN domain-containing protein [Ulvibacterium sp.]
MNIPYLENTTVGIDVSEKTLKWVEANKFGNNISVKSSGTLSYDSSEGSLKRALEEMKGFIKADVFKIAVSSSNILLSVLTEDIPFFDSEEERFDWVEKRVHEIEADQDKPVHILSQVYEIDEDYARCIFQIADQKKIQRLETVFREAGLGVHFVYSGCLEGAYTQIKEPDFTDGLSFVLMPEADRSYLSCYSNGMLSNFFILDAGFNEHPERLIKDAESIAQTESLSLNKEETIPLISVPEYHKKFFLEGGKEESVEFINPRISKNANLENEYVTALGLCIKSFYEGLDRFDFIAGSEKANSLVRFYKKACIKVAVLLFVPLLIIMLLSYSVHSYLDYELREINQITEKVADKLELVREKRVHLVSTYDDFNQVKNLIEQRVHSARIFEVINKSVSSNIWLTSMDVKKSREGYSLVLVGEANSSEAVTAMMRKLEQNNAISSVQLISSAAINDRSRGNTEEQTGALGYELRATFKS